MSEDRVYRYVLWREWDFSAVKPEELALGWDGFKQLKRSEDYAMFIGLNPSTADETKNDPTIRKCIGFAKRWGYGALCMCNLFAFRATDPRKMMSSGHPVGFENDKYLVQCAREAGIIIAAWGAKGSYIGRDEEVFKLLDNLQCLRLTKGGFPEHPLYVPYEIQPSDFP